MKFSLNAPFKGITQIIILLYEYVHRDKIKQVCKNEWRNKMLVTECQSSSTAYFLTKQCSLLFRPLGAGLQFQMHSGRCPATPDGFGINAWIGFLFGCLRLPKLSEVVLPPPRVTPDQLLLSSNKCKNVCQPPRRSRKLTFDGRLNGILFSTIIP